MDSFHRLGTKRSTGLDPETNASFAERSDIGTDLPDTAAGEGNANRRKKKLTYKDQM
jgi:hypothetical protein